jgi:hypothetical protein
VKDCLLLSLGLAFSALIPEQLAQVLQTGQAMRIVSLFFLLILFAFQPAAGAIKEMEVMADITGENPVDSQKKAIEYAKKRAFFLVLLEFDAQKAESIARSMTDEQIDTHIRGYQLIQDKLEGNRYLAKYKVSVSDDLVSRLVTTDTSKTNETTNPILILPVLNENSELLLWEADNFWRGIVNGVALELGENLLIMPYGDPSDVNTVSSATALSSRYEDLQKMAQRYGAREVVVALAEIKRDQTPKGVAVTLRRLGPDGLDKRKISFYEVTNAEAPADSALPDAARAMANELKDIARYYEGEEERRIANATKLKLQTQFRRLNDWVKLKAQLEQLPQVLRMDVDSIDIASAQATLYVNATPDAMRQIMEANGLAVNDTGGSWTIATY